MRRESAQFEEQAYNLQKNAPGTQIDVFKEAGPTLFVDEPGRFNPFVRDFVARLANYIKRLLGQQSRVIDRFRSSRTEDEYPAGEKRGSREKRNADRELCRQQDQC